MKLYVKSPTNKFYVKRMSPWWQLFNPKYFVYSRGTLSQIPSSSPWQHHFVRFGIQGRNAKFIAESEAAHMERCWLHEYRLEKYDSVIAQIVRNRVSQ